MGKRKNSCQMKASHVNSREKSQPHTGLGAGKEAWCPGPFPGGPVVGTPDFRRKGHRSTPWAGNRDPTYRQHGAAKKQNKTIKLRFRFSHSLEQCFLANRGVALQGPFDST